MRECMVGAPTSYCTVQYSYLPYLTCKRVSTQTYLSQAVRARHGMFIKVLLSSRLGAPFGLAQLAQAWASRSHPLGCQPPAVGATARPPEPNNPAWGGQSRQSQSFAWAHTCRSSAPARELASGTLLCNARQQQHTPPPGASRATSDYQHTPAARLQPPPAQHRSLQRRSFRSKRPRHRRRGAPLLLRCRSLCSRPRSTSRRGAASLPASSSRP